MMYHGWKLFLLTVALSASLSGCGDDPQQLYEEAQIAMANGRPELAVEKLQLVIKKRPEHADAIALRARANMELGQLTMAGKDIDTILSMAPGKPGGHILRGEWATRTIESLLDDAVADETPEFIKSFDQAVAAAEEEATWFMDRGERELEGHYLLARIEEMQAMRIEAILDRRKQRPGSAPLNDGQNNSNIENSEEIENEAALTTLPDEALTQRQDAHLDSALKHLRLVIASNEPHAQAEIMFNRLLLEGQHFDEMWTWMRSMAERKETPATVTHSLVVSLLVMPAEFKSIDDRAALAAKIHETTSPKEQDSIFFSLAGARIDMANRRWEQAIAKLDTVQGEAAGRFQDNLQARYLLSLCFFNTAQFDKAEEMLRVLGSQMPDAPEVQSLLGQVLLGRGHASQAKAALDQAIRIMPDEPATKQAWMMASAQVGDFTESATAIESYYEANPDNALAISLKARLERSRGNRQTVAAMIKKLESKDGHTVTHISELLDGYRFLGDLEKVQDYASKMRELDPDSARGQVVLVEALIGENRVDEARQLLNDLQQSNPDDPGVKLLVAGMLLRDQAYAHADQLLDELMTANPDSDDLRMMRAQSLVGIGKTTDAITVLEDVLADAPWYTPARAMTIRLYHGQRNPQKVAEHLHQIDRSRINEQDNPALLAQLAISDGNMAEGAAILDRAIKRGEKDPLLPVLLAMVRQRQDRHEEAEQLLVSMMEQYPDNAMGYQLYARFMLQQDRANKGLAKLEELVSHNEPVIRLMQGALLTSMNQHEKAIAKTQPVLIRQIATKGHYALPAAQFISQAMIVLNRPDEALAVYDQLIEANVSASTAQLEQVRLMVALDRHEQARRKLATMSQSADIDDQSQTEPLVELYIAMEDYDAAITWLDKLSKANPNEVKYLKVRAGLLRRLGELAAAESIYQQIIKLKPNDLQALQGLAQLYTDRGEYPRAESLLFKMSRIGREAEMISIASRGRLYMNVGLFDQANSMYQQLERMSPPRNPVLLASFAQAYYRLGRYETAATRLNEIEPFAPQYPVAQMMLAQIELQQQQPDDAGRRIRKLLSNNDVILDVMPLMLQVDLSDPATYDMVRWFDDNVVLEELPEDDRYNWATRRIEIHLAGEDWARAYDAAKDLSRIVPNEPGVAELELALAVKMNDLPRAKMIYNKTPDLRNSATGPLAAIAAGLQPDSNVETTPLVQFIVAMSNGDLATAKSLAADLPDHPTLYRTDLLTSLSHSSAGDELHQDAYHKLALAIFAWNTDGRELAIALTREVIRDRPRAAVSWGLLALWSPESVKESPVTPKGVSNYMQARRDRLDNKPELAASRYRAMLEIEKNEFITFELAKSMEQTEDYESAIEIHESLWSNNGPMKYTSGNDMAYLMIEHQPQRIDEAAAIARAVLENTQPGTGQAALLDTVGWIELKLGNHQIALEHLKTSVLTLGHLADVHRHLAEAYAANNEPTWAQYHRRQAKRIDEKSSVAAPVN